MQYAIVQASNIPNDDYEWHLHAAGCRDLKAPKYSRSERPFIIEAATAAEAKTDWHDDEMLEMGWTEDTTGTYPCAEVTA